MIDPLTVAAPLVALLTLVVFYARLRARHRGPAADWWETLRATILPPLDEWLRATDRGYAAYSVSPPEHVGTLHRPPELAEALLASNGYVRNPLAAYKTAPDGREEVGSWAWRPSPLARYQIHVILFETEEGMTDVYAHYEFSSMNPLTALRHYRGAEYVRLGDRLPSEVIEIPAALYEELS